MAEQLTAEQSVEAEQALLRRGKEILEHGEAGQHRIAEAIKASIPFHMAMQRFRDQREEAPPPVVAMGWVCLVLAAAEKAQRELET